MTASPAVGELLNLLSKMPAPFAAREERAGWVREKARVLRMLAAEYDAEYDRARSGQARDRARWDAVRARQLPTAAERSADELERGESL